MMSSRLQCIILLAVLSFYLLAALLYVTSVPLFEAPDEYFHFAVIAHLVQTGELPPLEFPPEKMETAAQPTRPWRQMTYHAPLYYFIAGALIAGQDTSHFGEYRLNPHAQIGVGTASHNINFLAHVPGNPTDRAAYTVRGLSFLLGAVTVAGVFYLGHAVFGNRRWSGLLPALIVVTNPQFLFISSVITNDNLVIALTTLTLLLLVHLIQRPFSYRLMVVVALLLACAALSKASGLVLYPVAGLTLLYLKSQCALSWRRLAICVVTIGAAFFLIAGWWYLRNWRLWGDPTATIMIARATGLRSKALTLDELGGLYYSSWGVFGWFNLQLPSGFFTLPTLLITISTVGWGRWAVSRPAMSRMSLIISGLFGLFTAAFIASWWHFNTQVMAAQGRLWFPLLGVFAITITWGLVQVAKAEIAAKTGIAVSIGLLFAIGVGALLTPLLLIQPAYQPDLGVPAANWQTPSDAVAFEMQEPWLENACLILWVQPYRKLADDQVEVPVSLETRCPVEGYWSFFVHFVDFNELQCLPGFTRSTLRQFDTMPEGGRLPFSALIPGLVVTDRLVVDVPPNLSRSRRYALHLGLYDAGGGSSTRAPLAGEGSENIQLGTCSSDYLMLDYAMR